MSQKRRDTTLLPLHKKEDIPKPAQNSQKSQFLALSAFLVTWVANGELLQAITNGKIIPYNKPVFVTWCSYNFMMLGGLVVVLRPRMHRKTFKDTLISWAGQMGVRKCILACAMLSYLLQILNILVVLGLECISVSLSNGIYQVQTAFTLGLSVLLLKDQLVYAEALGLLISLMGIGIMVVPPILWDDDSSSSQEILSCPWSDRLVGVWVTLASAAMGGSYLVSWRILDDARQVSHKTPIEGLVDTQMTLAVMGTCNLLIGWPLIVVAHWAGWEIFEWPDHWQWLFINGFVEYLFDASCAVAIYTTSPLVVAVASPLTAPISSIVDRYIYTAATFSIVPWIGAAITMVGVYVLQSKPQITCRYRPWCYRRTKQNQV